MEYIFVINIVRDINIDTIFYNFGQIFKSLTCPKPSIAFFLVQSGYITADCLGINRDNVSLSVYGYNR